jgi:hypothetical protein
MVGAEEGGLDGVFEGADVDGFKDGEAVGFVEGNSDG